MPKGAADKAMFTGGGGGFGATNPGQGAMMLELTKPPAAADRPVSALDCGKPVSLVHCCPLELTTNGEQAATLVLAAGEEHATLLTVKAAEAGGGPELHRVDRALPVVGRVAAAARPSPSAPPEPHKNPTRPQSSPSPQPQPAP